MLFLRKLIVLLLLPLSVPHFIYGQAKTEKFFNVMFKVRDEAVSPISGVSIVIFDKLTNDVVATFTTPGDGNVSFALDLYKEYIITLSKKDYVSKQVWIDGNVTGKENKTKFHFEREEIVYLYSPSSDKLGAELLNKPYLKFSYDASGNDMVVNKEYEAGIKKEVDALSAQVKTELISKIKSGDPAKDENENSAKIILPGEDDPGFDFLGSTIKELVKKNEPRPVQAVLTDAKVVVYSGTTRVVELKTDKKDGRFRTRLPYGHLYKVVISHPSTVPMFLTIDTRIPQDKYNIRTGREVYNIPCVDKKSVDIDTVKYRFAFDKYFFDLKKKALMRDEKYFQEFLNGTNADYLAYRASLKEKKPDAETKAPDKTAPQRINYLSGKILSGDPATVPVRGVKVVLLGDRGEPMQTNTSNNYGRFLFTDVLFDQHYTLKIDDDAKKQLAGQKITILNRNDKEVTVIFADAGGKFTFRLLSSDKKTLELLGSEEESLMISGNLLALINNITQPIANTKVQLVNEKGEMIEAVLTNEFGNFVFTKLPPNQNFLIELAEGDPKLANVRVIITDKNGKEINSTVCNSSGKFKFQFLKQDELKLQTMEVDETELRLDMNGKLFKNTSQQALANTKVDLVNDNNKVVQSTSTDNAGNFKFSKVGYEKNYSISANADPRPDKIILADSKGVVIKEYKTGNLIGTIKMPLLSADQQKITTVSMDDPWLKVSSKGMDNSKKETLVIPERVYFELNDFKITNEGMVILDKVIQVMKGNSGIKMEVSSHTDSQGSDEYNLELSKKRAKSAVDYMIAKGIAKERVTGIGYGETKPVNKCVNGVTCTEDEHAQNRRLEFKVMYLK